MPASEPAPLYRLLHPAFAGDYDQRDPASAFRPLLPPSVRLLKLPKGAAFINSGLPVTRVYLLLAGKCHIVKYSADGKGVIADTMYPIQMFGLYELLGRVPAYRATVTTAAASVLLDIPADYFLDGLRGDMQTAMLVMEYLAGVMERSIALSDRKLFNSDLQNLVLYFCQQCYGQTLPYTVPASRKTISEEVNINLRTLYRYLDKLKQRDCLSVVRGKLVISEEQHARLEQLAGEMEPGLEGPPI